MALKKLCFLALELLLQKLAKLKRVLRMNKQQSYEVFSGRQNVFSIRPTF